jgi:hypothetical protein
VLVAPTAAGLVAGFVARSLGHAEIATLVWALATVPVLIALALEIVTRLKHGDVGLDIVTLISRRQP